MYDKLKVPFSFAWEVYTDEKSFPELEAYKAARKKNKMKKVVKNFLAVDEEITRLNKNLNNLNTSTTLEGMITKKLNVKENNLFLKLFNPLDKDAYDFLIDNWSKAYTSLLNQVYTKRDSK